MSADFSAARRRLVLADARVERRSDARLPQRAGHRREVVESAAVEAGLEVIGRGGGRLRPLRRAAHHRGQVCGEPDAPLGGPDAVADAREVAPSRVDRRAGDLERLPGARDGREDGGRSAPRRSRSASSAAASAASASRSALQRLGAQRGCSGPMAASRAADRRRSSSPALCPPARASASAVACSAARRRCDASASAARAAAFAASASAMSSGVTGSPPRGAGEGCSTEPHTAHGSPATSASASSPA